MPLCWLNVQTRIVLGTECRDNRIRLPSNCTASLPIICCKTSGDAQAPMVKPSGLHAIVEMVGGDQIPPAPVMFSTMRGRISRQVAADVARQHARVKIERAARRVTDDDRQRFVLVELLRLRRACCEADDQNDCRKRKQNIIFSLLSFLPISQPRPTNGITFSSVRSR